MNKKKYMKYVSNRIRKLFQAHPYHLVSPSPWPICTCIALFSLTSSFVCYMQHFEGSIYVVYLSLSTVLASLAFWWRDVITEGTLLGNHTSAVQKGINIGVALFIISEGLFFLAIFWAFFHSALAPTVELGAQWPPLGIIPIDSYELPLLNTALLLSSGFSVTFSHHSIIAGDRKGSIYGLLVTLVLALIFTCLQGVEYMQSLFTISDGIFGSTFYFSTGFHGIHVIIGTLFLIVGLLRQRIYHFTQTHSLGLESGILYWHFVDIVWLVLYVSVYYWGS